MRNRVLLAAGVLMLGVLVGACRTPEPRVSGPSYGSAAKVAAKLEAADLGCTEVKPAGELVPNYGADKPDVATCTLDTSGKPTITITRYEDEDSLRGFLNLQQQAITNACTGSDDPAPTRHVEGANFMIEGPLDEALAEKLMTATGGSVTTIDC